MTTTTATGDTRGWPSLLLRFALVGFSAVVGVAIVAATAVYAAFTIEWELPPTPELSGPSVVLDAEGDELARFTAQVDRTEVDLDEISEPTQNAVVASEDAEFYEHTGVDISALVRAVYVNVRSGSIRQGGSTLTQQYVKNAFVGDEVSLRRKVEEAVLSISLEKRMTKDEILESYLNTVYFGEGASGIEAAAQTYFGVTAADLSLGQGATLAQLLPAPSVWNPVVDPAGAEQRRNDLLDRMERLDMASPGDVAEAKAADVGVVEREPDLGPQPYVVQHVKRLLTEAYGEEEVLTGSLRVTTTIRPAAMDALEQAVQQQLPRQEDRPGVDAGAIAVEPSSGEVLAWYGGRDYDESQFDLAMQARRRPGSTFKPIAYLAALEQGIDPETPYSAPGSFRKGELCDPGWGPSNAGGSSFGSVPMREGLFRSINTVFAQIGCDVGSEKLDEVATRLGIRTDLEQTPQLAIGGFGSNTTVADLSQVYATFANDGVQCPLRTIARVVDRNGQRLDPPPETTPQGEPRAPSQDVLDTRPSGLDDDEDDVAEGCSRVADRDDVRRITDALQLVVRETTGTRADIARPQAGKTGTTDDEVDAWFAGYTPDLALVVRVGDEVEEPLTDIEGFSRVQGGTIPALIWHDAATLLLDGVAETGFPEPGLDDDEVSIPGTPRRPDPSPSASPSPSPEPTQPDPQPEPQPEPEPTQPAPSPSPTDDGGGLLGGGGNGGGDAGGGNGGGGNGGGGNGGGGDDGCGLLQLGCDPDG